MELGSNFAAKLEPFLLMAKSLKGAAAAKLIQDATSAPGVFVFTELLELPNIQELAKSEQYSPFFSLLQLFSYQTYQDYIQNKDSFPPLNSAQIIKLKHLSLVTLSMDNHILQYSTLQRALDIERIRELEDLIIDAIYLDILRAKLDQKEQQLEVEYTMGRDLKPGHIENVLATLNEWAATTAAVLHSLDRELVKISSEATANKLHHDEHERALSATLKDILERQKDKSGMGLLMKRGFLGNTGLTTGGDKDGMDVDDPGENAKGKNRKAPQEPTTKQQRKRNRF